MGTNVLVNDKRQASGGEPASGCVTVSDKQTWEARFLQTTKATLQQLRRLPDVLLTVTKRHDRRAHGARIGAGSSRSAPEDVVENGNLARGIARRDAGFGLGKDSATYGTAARN